MERRFPCFGKSGPIPKPPASHTWEELMGLALEAAKSAYARDEVPVGALVADPYGKVYGPLANCRESLFDPTAHAEILAIRMACRALHNWALPDCVLVTTLEPCVMCGSAILQARLGGIVFGAYDAQAGAITALDLFDGRQNTGRTWRMGGVLEKECSDLLNRFFAGKRSKNA